MKTWFNKIKSYTQIKTATMLLSSLLFIPFLTSIYWLLATSYYSFFGISPELYSRPAFSSGFMSAWLFSVSLTKAYLVWIVFAAIIFVISVVIKWVNKRTSTKTSNINDHKHNQSGTTDENSSENCFKWRDIEDSFKLPFLFLIGGTAIVMSAVMVITTFSAEGKKIAEKQMNLYLKKDFECFDGFDANNVGCFEIEGIKDKNLLVLTNTKTHLIFLSREDDENKKASAKLQVVEKEPTKRYTIYREYRTKD